VCRILDASVSNAIVVGNESPSRILFVLILPNVVDDLFLRSCQNLMLTSFDRNPTLDARNDRLVG
jgi:hypothetical protein